MSSSSRPYLLLSGVTKTFGSTHALQGFDLGLYPGEIHALVGQNGSGKSTLIKILSGYHTPDAGTLTVLDRQLALPLTPKRAAACGLRFVHQSLGFAPAFTVLEMIRLDAWRGSFRRIHWRSERARVSALLEELGADFSPDEPVGRLTPSQQATVAIARALQGIGAERAALILDEPTASLGRADTERLFTTLRTLKGHGHAVLFISHRLDEVLAIADRVTVLRDGRGVMSRPIAEVTEAGLVMAILGRPLDALYPEPPTEIGDASLRIKGLWGATVRDVSLTVGKGEIVGITGLAGMGHDEIPYLLYGATVPRRGRIVVDGQPVEPVTPRTSQAAGVALLPADRERAGGVRRATVAENITMGSLDTFFRRGWIREREEAATVSALLNRFEVRPPDPTLAFGALSGGNQQKALLAKWLQTAPRVLLLHEPTQGIDVGSRQQVFRIIKRTAEAGAAVLIASTEYADLAHICNRVLVMRSGQLVAELRGEELSEASVIQTCYTTPGARAAAG